VIFVVTERSSQSPRHPIPDFSGRRQKIRSVRHRTTTNRR
jgi:hypothetical protein